jgi:hypothetical protein
MSDARWADVEADVDKASGHFRMAARLFDAGGLSRDVRDTRPDEQDVDTYRNKMAILHAGQSGHTSLEAALVRILDILNEEVPSGEQSHADLIRRAGKGLVGPGHDRPAILSAEAADDADETCRFRHRAAHDDDNFDPARAIPAIEAARRLASSLKPCLDRFRRIVDPPGGDRR